jgi:hypothetical protein
MMLPTIHKNGTSKDTLIEQYMEASNALYSAILAMQAAAPNARDYYPQGDAAFLSALEEYRAHATALQKTRMWLESLIEHCDTAGEE